MASEAQARTETGFGHVLNSFTHWWQSDVAGTVDQAAVIARRREDCGMTPRYLLLLSMSAGIAILGLLLSSPAVVIGAMLLSPLMGPIMGLGFAFAIGDFGWMRESARSLIIGTVISVLFCALVVFFSPLQTVTSEIAARTRPNLFDLLVALFSAIAGAYAMIRGRADAIVGVAIATALMPPLAVVGFGLATFNWTVFSGALLLFFTNLMTIALTAAVLARLYGFRTNLSERQTDVQTFIIIAIFVALAIPLFLSLRQIAWEANATRQINATVMNAFDNRARLSQIETNLNVEPIQVAATILTPTLNPEAERITARAMSRSLGEPVEVSITQYRVGTSAQAAEEAQLRNALEDEKAAAAYADRLADELSLVAGVPAGEVLVDRGNRVATVRARALPGATLSAYRQLEQRVAAEERDWSIRLVPPQRPLPQIAFEEDAPSAQGRSNLATAAWAQARIAAPIRITGPAEAAALVQQELARGGGQSVVVDRGAGFGTVTLDWADPNDITEPQE